MEPRFIVTIVCTEEGYINIYDTKTCMYANSCAMERVREELDFGIDKGLDWEDTQQIFGDFKEINLPLEAYLLLN
jgi:hypothetical protein